MFEYLRIEQAFDDYYPYMRAGLCNLRHVRKWLILFVFIYNSVVKSATKFANLRRWKYLS